MKKFFLDLSRRQIGMFLAEKLFSIFDCPFTPKFDYIEQDPLLQEFKTAIHDGKERCSQLNMNEMFDGSKVINQPFEKNCNSTRQKRLVNPRVALLDSDDDFDEIEDERVITTETFPEPLNNYEKPNIKQVKPESLHRRQQFTYLSDCIEALRCEKECQNWEAAFKAIPDMIKRKSLGLDILSAELFETLLFMENRFNTPDFSVPFIEKLKSLVVFRALEATF